MFQSTFSENTWSDSLFDAEFSAPLVDAPDSEWVAYIRNRNRLLPGGWLSKIVQASDPDAAEKTKMLLKSRDLSLSDKMTTFIEIPAKHGLPVNMQSTRYKVEVLEDGSSHRKSPKGQEDLQLPRKRAYEEPVHGNQVTLYKSQKRRKLKQRRKLAIQSASPVAVVANTQWLSTLAQCLNKQRKNRHSCDVQLCAMDDSLRYAHSVVLRVSEYFAKIFDMRAKGQNSTPMFISVQMRGDLLDILLDFLYTGNTTLVTRDNVLEVYTIACEHDVDGLSVTCAERLKELEIINPANCISILILINKWPRSKAYVILKEYILEKLSEETFLETVLLQDLSSISQLNAECLQTLLLMYGKLVKKSVVPKAEKQLFDAVLQWLKSFLNRNQLAVDDACDPLANLTSLSYHLLDNYTDTKKTFRILVPAKNSWKHSAVADVGDCKFTVQYSKSTDANNKDWLNVKLKPTEDALGVGFLRNVVYSLNVISDGGIFSCVEKQERFQGPRHESFEFEHVIAIEDMLDEMNSFVNDDNFVKMDLFLTTDYITGFVTDYVIRHFDTVWRDNSTGVLQCDITLLTFILSQDNLNVTSEGTVLQVICFWLTDEFLDLDLFQPQQITDLLNCVRWKYINFQDITTNTRMLQSCPNLDLNVLTLIGNSANNLKCPNLEPRASYRDTKVPAFQCWNMLFSNDFVFLDLWKHHFDNVYKTYKQATELNSPSREEVLRLLNSNGIIEPLQRQNMAEFVIGTLQKS